MKIITEVNSVYDFEFWSGARDTVAELTPDEVESILSVLEETYPDGMTDTQLNDFFWFERDTIANWLGYEDFDQIMEINKRGCDNDCANCTDYQCPYCENEPEEDAEEDEEDEED